MKLKNIWSWRSKEIENTGKKVERILVAMIFVSLSTSIKPFLWWQCPALPFE